MWVVDFEVGAAISISSRRLRCRIPIAMPRGGRYAHRHLPFGRQSLGLAIMYDDVKLSIMISWVHMQKESSIGPAAIKAAAAALRSVWLSGVPGLYWMVTVCTQAVPSATDETETRRFTSLKRTWSKMGSADHARMNDLLNPDAPGLELHALDAIEEHPRGPVSRTVKV